MGLIVKYPKVDGLLRFIFETQKNGGFGETGGIGFLRYCCFPKAQDLGKVQSCH